MSRPEKVRTKKWDKTDPTWSSNCISTSSTKKTTQKRLLKSGHLQWLWPKTIADQVDRQKVDQVSVLVRWMESMLIRITSKAILISLELLKRVNFVITSDNLRKNCL